MEGKNIPHHFPQRLHASHHPPHFTSLIFPFVQKWQSIGASP
jgi:hypothetical protein